MGSEVEQLRSKLKETEAQQFAIAKLAKEILEKDRDKDRRLSALGEENLQQSRDIARLQALLKTRDEYLADAENEVGKLQKEIAEMNEKKSAYMIELEQKISSLRAQVTENNGMLSDREQEVEELKKSLLAKERELEEALAKPLGEVSMNRTRDSSADSEKCKLYDKVVELEKERNSMLEEISQLQDKVAMINRDLANERSHVEELSAICDGYKVDVKELRQRCNDLTCELNDYRSGSKVAKKGNSMFFEFVDERVKLEKDLLKLKARNDFLVSQKEAYERELDEVRQELMLALTLHSSREDTGGITSALQEEISRLRSELAALNAKSLGKFDKNDKAETAVDTSQPLVDLKEYALNSLKEEVRNLTRKLDIAQQERADYFDKYRELESRFAEESMHSRELRSEVACLKQRLVIEQKKNLKSVSKQAVKPSREILAEKIAVINKIDAGDSTVSQVQSSFTLTDASIAKRGQLTALRENETDEGAESSTMKTLPNDESTEIVSLQSSTTESLPQTTEKSVPVEKRLRFQSPNESLRPLVPGRDAAGGRYVPRRKPNRRIFKRVCEADNLHIE